MKCREIYHARGQSAVLKSKLQTNAESVNIAGVRMTVVLPDVIQFECEMRINLLSTTQIETVADPCVGDRVIENLIRGEALKLGMPKSNCMRYH